MATQGVAPVLRSRRAVKAIAMRVHRRRAVSLAAVTVLVALGCERSVEPEPPDPLVSYLETRRAETGFQGVVVIERADRTLLRRAFGYADLEYRIPLTPEHIFRIGSVTKPITAMAVLTLVESGRLELDEPICELLSSCPESWRGVTVRHLLSHTSGLPDLFGELPEAPVQETRAEIDRLLARIAADPLATAPGTEYAYSNFNYMLLGYAIEVASAELWADYLRSVFFEPLGMSDTGYDDVWEILPGRATGYASGDAGLVNVEYEDHSAYAAGGLRSTADDLAAWLEALLAGGVIGGELLDQATRPYRANYGYGWQVLELFGRRMYNHTGGIEGFSAHVAVYPDEALRLVVLSNRADEDTKATACDLAAILFADQPLPKGDAAWLGTPRAERCRETARPGDGSARG